MKAVSFMYVRPPGFNAESAKAAEIADERRRLEQDSPSHDGPSTAMYQYTYHLLLTLFFCGSEWLPRLRKKEWCFLLSLQKLVKLKVILVLLPIGYPNPWLVEIILEKRGRNHGPKMCLVVLCQLKKNLKSSKMHQGVSKWFYCSFVKVLGALFMLHTYNGLRHEQIVDICNF